ncbi:hypothetical protein A2V71_01305 [Candidatus Berkelbacteria bacterium RBG_13_40_8]|uniref:GIY-YIG domain-containing protein n=1 Tax=Candidatus Berkelbacteria bacterium RBG_13_40_8 TaxID=1797467 RepID=A0A1F5DMS4_9BACT|nr:MAG: hypothetical protein A2V71_01305 [Candidatus Berkelbacteria bacterium RBG_13_40_8]
MYFVYVLISRKDHKLYIGSTPDIKARIIKHNRGFVKATKNRRPIKLIYFEGYEQKDDAQKREIYLKGGKGHEELKIQLKKTLSKNRYLEN